MNEFRRLIAGPEPAIVHQTIDLEAMLEIERQTVEK